MIQNTVKRIIQNGKITIFGFQLSWQFRSLNNIGFKPLSTSSRSPYKLHIGPGPDWVKPSPSWLSIDIDPSRGDIILDFHHFEEIPLPSNSVSSVYASHTLEHISIYRIERVIKEIYRVLIPGGLVRIVVPNPEVSIKEYIAGNHDFKLFERRRDRAKKLYGHDLTIFECLKEDFISRNGQPEFLGEKLAHQNAWDYEAMVAQLVRGGFSKSKIRKTRFQDIGSEDFQFEGTYHSEANDFERSLYVEATK